MEPRRPTPSDLATAKTGQWLWVAVLVGFLWERSQGRDGSPYGELVVFAGVVFLLAVAWYRRRR
jgi:hypothetical protein